MNNGNGTTSTLDLAGLIDGGAVACAGPLTSLTPEQFREVIEQLGGRVVPASGPVAEPADVVVVGSGVLPLARDGGLALPPLRSVQARVIAEEQFLYEMKVATDEDLAVRQFTGDALAALLHVPRPRIAAWMRAGLIRPAAIVHGVPRFAFSQAAAARTLAGLTAAGVSTATIRQSLQRLRKLLPNVDEPLAQLAILERGGKVMVRLEAGEVAEPDGQLHIDYATPAPSAAERDPPFQLRLVPGPRSSADWHEQGVDQELHGLLAEAEHSYREALLVGGPDAQICFDLAHVLAAQGKREIAGERYRQVVELDPKRADAWNNLGVLLGDMGDAEAARAAFREALAVDPHDALAHFNLAGLLESAGLVEQSREHWAKALKYGAATPEAAAYAASRLTARAARGV